MNMFCSVAFISSWYGRVIRHCKSKFKTEKNGFTGSQNRFFGFENLRVTRFFGFGKNRVGNPNGSKYHCFAWYV